MTTKLNPSPPREADGEFQATAPDILDGKIVAIYVVRNPDKHLH